MEFLWVIFTVGSWGFTLSAADYGMSSTGCACSTNSSIHQVITIPASIAAPIPATRPFQRLVRAGDSVYVTGVQGVDLVSQVVAPGGYQAEAIQCIKNIRILLGLVGCDLGNIYMLTIFVRNMTGIPDEDMGVVQAFSDANQPINFAALKFVAGVFVAEANVEIAAIANGCKWPN